MMKAVRISAPISAPRIYTERSAIPAKGSDRSSRESSDTFVPVALFCGIGMLVSLVAVIFGVQGVWL
jgi:hypothetical protein